MKSTQFLYEYFEKLKIWYDFATYVEEDFYTLPII